MADRALGMVVDELVDLLDRTAVDLRKTAKGGARERVRQAVPRIVARAGVAGLPLGEVADLLGLSRDEVDVTLDLLQRQGELTPVQRQQALHAVDALRTRLLEVVEVVRTLRIPDMRRAGLAQNANGVVFAPHHDDRRVVVSAPLNAGGDGDVLDNLRVLAPAAGGGPPGLRLARPRPINLAGIDQDPPVQADETPIDTATRRATGLEINVLPLIPVFEAVEDRSALARSRVERFQALLETTNPRAGTLPPVPRGVLAAGIRWLLDAERGPMVTAASAAGSWRNAAACQALEHTLLVSPLLRDPDWQNANRRWWRADAVSAADFAQVDLGVGATFASRSLRWELIPVLAAAVPRLLGLFARRTINLSSGHGLYTKLPVANPNAQNTIFRTQRPEWAGYTQPTAGNQGRYLDNTRESWCGEDENVVGIAVSLHAIATANGADVISAREVDQTLPGRRMVVDGAGNATFVAVDTVVFPDFPRLWQQNAYYGIGVSYDAIRAPADRVVNGLPSLTAVLAAA